jgi:thiamine biosynthesis protein ThiS
MVTINGKPMEGAEGMTLGDLLRAEGYDLALVAAGLNGTVVRKADYGTVRVGGGDTVEVFRFMGGG